MATYMVTGAAGFIASRVAHQLLADGHTVVAVDEVNDAYDVRLKRWRLGELVHRQGFEYHQVDIRDRAALGRVFSRKNAFAAALHLAGRAGVRQSVEDPWVYLESNATGTLNMLELCRRHGVPQLILSSTSSLYGAHNPRPFREDADTDRPLSPYAASKKAAEVLCHTYHHLYGLDATVLRYFTVYGPAGRPDMSPFRFVQWISEGQPVTVYGDGQQSRDFTYVDDVARGTIAAIGCRGFQTFNLGSDRPIVLIDAIKTIEEAVGRRAQLEFKPAHQTDVPATWADISRARTILGWEPTTSFRDGIARTVAWYRDNREWAKDIAT